MRGVDASMDPRDSLNVYTHHTQVKTHWCACFGPKEKRIYTRKAAYVPSTPERNCLTTELVKVRTKYVGRKTAI